MSVVDLVVLAIVVLAALRGWRRGGTGLVLRVAGAVAGVLIAGALARWLLPAVTEPDATISQGALALGAALVGALVGWGLGRRLGVALARRGDGAYHRPGIPDRLLGVAAHAGLALVVLVLAAGIVGVVGPAGLDRAARDSAVLDAASTRLPDPLGLLPGGDRLIAGEAGEAGGVG